MKQFTERFGRFRDSPHLEFCAELNLDLINHYNPKAVVSVGITYCELAARLYSLNVIEEVKVDGRRVLIHCRDRQRPWIFTKHWSGARPSRKERELMKDYIAKHASPISATKAKL